MSRDPPAISAWLRSAARAHDQIVEHDQRDDDGRPAADALADSHDLYDHTGIGRYVDAIARVFLGRGDGSSVDLDGPDGAAFQRRRDSCLSGVKRETEQLSRIGVAATMANNIERMSWIRDRGA
jgi:hypothetical protein